MGLCGWIVFGFLVGLIARAIMPGTQRMGFLRTTLLGIGGSFAGGLIFSLLRGGDPFGRVLVPASFIGSIIGALLLLFLFGRTQQR